MLAQLHTKLLPKKKKKIEFAGENKIVGTKHMVGGIYNIITIMHLCSMHTQS